jgi:hypothetical protein
LRSRETTQKDCKEVLPKIKYTFKWKNSVHYLLNNPRTSYNIFPADKKVFNIKIHI